MPLIERHIFRRVCAASTAIFACLLGIFWVIRSLDKFDLVTADGHSIWIYQIVTVLLLTLPAKIILPVAFLCGMLATLTRMNSDSELAVLMAAGAPRITVVRPILIAAVLVSGILLSLQAVLSPASLKAVHELVSRIRAQIINTAVDEGGFRELDGKKLTVHVRAKAPDGSFRGVFINDTRDETEFRQFVAGSAVLVQEPTRAFLILADGTLVRENTTDLTTEIIDFKTHAVDLSQFLTVESSGGGGSSHRSMSELLNPNPNDSNFEQNRIRFLASFHNRLAVSLFPLSFAALVLAALARPRSARQDRIAAILVVSVLCASLIILSLVLRGMASSGVLDPLVLYLVPVGAFIVGIASIAANARYSVPVPVVAAVMSVTEALRAAVPRLWPDRQTGAG